jgi:hypothetical protein
MPTSKRDNPDDRTKWILLADLESQLSPDQAAYLRKHSYHSGPDGGDVIEANRLAELLDLFRLEGGDMP